MEWFRSAPPPPPPTSKPPPPKSTPRPPPAKAVDRGNYNDDDTDSDDDGHRPATPPHREIVRGHNGAYRYADSEPRGPPGKRPTLTRYNGPKQNGRPRNAPKPAYPPTKKESSAYADLGYFPQSYERREPEVLRLAKEVKSIMKHFIKNDYNYSQKRLGDREIDTIFETNFGRFNEDQLSDLLEDTPKIIQSIKKFNHEGLFNPGTGFSPWPHRRGGRRSRKQKPKRLRAKTRRH